MNYLVHHFKMLKDGLFLLMILQIMTKIKSNRKYFLPRAENNKYNVLIDERNFYDQSINDLVKQYDEVRRR